jgi:hypothetical protein
MLLPIVVTQVDKDMLAVVTQAVHQPGEGDGPAIIEGAELPARAVFEQRPVCGGAWCGSGRSVSSWPCLRGWLLLRQRVGEDDLRAGDTIVQGKVLLPKDHR